MRPHRPHGHSARRFCRHHLRAGLDHRPDPIRRQPFRRGRAYLRPQLRQRAGRSHPAGAARAVDAARPQPGVRRLARQPRGEDARAGAVRASHQRAHPGGLPDRRGGVCRAELQVRPARAGARLTERSPSPYLTGEAWCAGRSCKSAPRALVPRSPIAELIENGFEPWLGGREVSRALDLCTGSGCIAIATGHHHPDWEVVGIDISDDALALAAENKARLHASNVSFRKSDLFDGLQGEVFDLIVTNPPYVTHEETDALPAEYAHEPELGLRAGDDGLDLALRIMRDAPAHLSDDGLLICEVGEA